ncbi:MAG: hypothetical protein QXM16_00925 [Nitrososphaerota archaeon]
MDVDILVHGSDISGVLIWFELSRAGFNVLLAHRSMRICERLAYLPFTTEWARYVKKLGVNEFSEEHKILLRTSESFCGRFYPAIKVCVGDARKISEQLLSIGGGVVENWCRDVRWRKKGEGVEYVVLTRAGERLEGSAKVLIDTEQEKVTGGDVVIHTSLSTGKDALLDLSGPSILLTVPHSRLKTHVQVGGEIRRPSGLCRTTLPLGKDVDLGIMPLLYAGMRSGLVKPPWIGDHLTASALLSVKIAENWLSKGDRSQSLLAYLTELTARSNMFLDVARRAVEGSIKELELSYIFEGLRPPPLPSCRL